MAVFNAAVQLNKILFMAFRALGHPFHPSIADPLGDFVVRMVNGDSTVAKPRKAMQTERVSGQRGSVADAVERLGSFGKRHGLSLRGPEIRE